MWFPLFVGLMHLPRIGPTFSIVLPGLKVSLHPSSEFTQSILLSSISFNERPFSAMDFISIIFQASVISFEFGKVYGISRGRPDIHNLVQNDIGLRNTYSLLYKSIC